ncbi:MAG: nucleotidyltransferase family protein [Clostridia bacterium]|nr:nucleotidyltransferase family protein [Clostridia bacterium]
MTAGIVCEYNPFHKGHLYHIIKTKEAGADFIVCVMSGNFVQRGECAYADKWTRAKAAIVCGADVVIDLPVPWACASAENFARGSVGLLCDFGIDMLSFGSESGDAQLLKRCADALDDPDIAAYIKEKMASGASYPAALCEAVGKKYGEKASSLLSSPNSTLAVEYIRALNKISPDVRILPVKRKGSGHDSEEIAEGTASASKIRTFEKLSFAAEYLPEKAFSLFEKAFSEGNGPYNMKTGERAVLSAVREMKKEDYSLYVTDSSGLANRIYEAARTAGSLDSLYEKAKSKNFTHSRVRREVMNLFLKIPKDMSKEKVPYMRILAVSEKGISLLSRAKENSSVPVITRHSETVKLSERGKEVYSLQCSSTDKFALFTEKIRECSLEQKNSMIKINADSI